MDKQILEKVLNALKELAKRKPIFHSEEELQNYFGNAMLMLYPDSLFKLSRRRDAGLNYPKPKYDLWVEFGGIKFLVNIKYVTSAYKDDEFMLLDQGYEETQIFDFLKDVERIEKLSKDGVFGFNIFLTNCSSYWENSENDLNIADKTEVKGSITWKKQYLDLKGDYSCIWMDYSKLKKSAPNSTFRYLLFKVY